jgi:hypothetical protein
MRRSLLTVLLACTALAVALPASAQPAQPAAGPSARAAAAPMDPAERKAVVEDLASKLQATFVFPDVGARYAAMLRAKLAKGAYDRITDPEAFGAAVTADLQAVASDGHLKLMPKSWWDAKFAPKPSAAGASAGPAEPFGLAETRMIGHVAYLRFNGFPGDDGSPQKARQFLLAHAGEIGAVIIDSRGNHGGGLDEMNAILPLLYDRTTTLVRMDTRAAAGPPPFEQGVERRPSPPEVIREDHVVHPDTGETRLEHVPVYYLTSSKTVSAAEHLALAFRHTHRAVQIGETTRGAGHYGGLEKIGDRFAAFIPIGRTYDPDTGWDWEGKGVAPDIAVPADQALSEALKQARAKGIDTGPAS